MLKNILNFQIILLAVIILPGLALAVDEGRLETINISADIAYEDMQPGILHFEGHFLMHRGDWELESEKATVYGPPDRPDKVSLRGNPARFLIMRNDGESQSIVEAEAPTMEYMRSTNMLELTGGAILKLNDEVIRSTVIKYNIDNDRYWAGGIDGVLIEVPPVD